MSRDDLRWLFWLLTAAAVGSLLVASMPHAVVRKNGADLPAPMIAVDAAGRIHISADGDVHYSLDGSLPTAISQRYIGPFLLDERSATARITTIPTSIQWRHPAGHQPSGAVVRACQVDAQGHAGQVSTMSFLPHIHGDLPVLSLALPPGAFFDPDTGIYVVGNAICDTKQDFVRHFPVDQKWWKYPGNFHYRGKQAERSGHLMYFAPRAMPGSSPEWEADVKLRINGNNTRGFPQHALRVTFHRPLEQALFGSANGVGSKRIILRSSGNDQDRTFFRDALQHRLCRDLPFETSASVQSVLYVNGAYWGVHNIRERIDQDELGRRYRLQPKEITILADRMVLYEGDEREVKRFARFLTLTERWDASASWFVDSLEERMDVDGFLCYMAAQIVLGNLDWPEQNVKWWRYTGAPDTSSARGDGRWYFIMGDSDLSFGMNSGPDVDMFRHVDQHATAPVSRLFKACLRSAVLRDRFRGVVLDLLAGPLSTKNMVDIGSSMRDAIAAEMPRHIDRWRRPTAFSKWNANVDVLLTFARERGDFVRTQLDEKSPIVLQH